MEVGKEKKEIKKGRCGEYKQCNSTIQPVAKADVSVGISLSHVAFIANLLSFVSRGLDERGPLACSSNSPVHSIGARQKVSFLPGRSCSKDTRANKGGAEDEGVLYSGLLIDRAIVAMASFEL